MRRSGVLIFLCVLLLSAQTSEFIPKSKKESERDRQSEISDRKKISSAGIYSINSVRYAYRFGKVDKNGILESTIRYDDRGNKIKELSFGPSDGSVSSTTNFRFDKNGNLIEETEVKGTTTLKSIHRYNSRNNRIESVIYKADGKVDRKISFIYDDNGLLLESVGKLDDGRIFMRDSYLYDARGNVIEFKNNLKKITILYDRKGNIVSIVKYQRYFKSHDSIQYNINERFAFDYDGAERVSEMRSYRPDSALKSRTQYLRNEKGMLLEEKEYSGDAKLTYSRLLKYDKQNNLIEESGTDRALRFKTTYKYDTRGIKTEMITYDQVNEPVSVVRYSFGRNGGFAATQMPSNTAALGDSLMDEDEEPGTKEEFFQLLGARIIAPDGTYLGMIVADTANPQSIIHDGGQYASNQSPSSIFNPSIPYGGEKGIFSPFNPQSPSPPSVFKDGKFYTYLTENDVYRPRSAPYKLVQFIRTLAKQN
ncbi:MAG: hypothetical protein ACOYNS_11990 [Bacteroidota bacterium]